jgi:hypothetical protein
VVFHFNKKHLEDPTIPMWVIKTKGESYYVEHVSCDLPWTTKETPGNSHTKGSLKVKRCHLVIDDSNHAHIKELTPEVEARLSNPQVVIRIITMYGAALKAACEGLTHNLIKRIGGGCSTLFFITEFNSAEEYVMMQLKLGHAPDLRELKPNESYYKLYGEQIHHTNDCLNDDDDDDYSDLYEN